METCETMNGMWGYKITDQNYKSTKTLIHYLVKAAGKNANLLMNIGPQPDGDFRPEEKKIADFIGKWMKKNSECIYGCDYAGWEKQDWGYYTRKSNQVYMVVFNPPYSGQLTVKTPKGITITTAKTLTGEQTQVTETTRNEYNVSLPKNMPQEPFVIKLEVKDAQKTQDKYREALT